MTCWNPEVMWRGGNMGNGHGWLERRKNREREEEQAFEPKRREDAHVRQRSSSGTINKVFINGHEGSSQKHQGNGAKTEKKKDKRNEAGDDSREQEARGRKRGSAPAVRRERTGQSGKVEKVAKVRCVEVRFGEQSAEERAARSPPRVP